MKPGSIAPVCGFGIVTRKFPRRIHPCFPPGNGPSKPSFRNLRTSSRLDTGLRPGIPDPFRRHSDRKPAAIYHGRVFAAT